jgi:transposase
VSTSLPHRGVVHLGLDVSKDWIAVGVLRPEEVVPDTEKVFHDEESVRRLIARLGPPAGLRACYEAGPTGYELHRLLTSLGVRCDVIAPSMIPRAPGDKVKTDKRDCRRLARLHRAGELTAIRVPTPAEEGVRDVCRARQVAVEDLARARHRLGSFLLRHSVVWRGGTNWSMRHRQWVATRSFEDAATRSAFSFYLAEVTTREASLDAMDAELTRWCSDELFADAVGRLGAYRGIDALGALTLAVEVCDFRRFATARSFMGFCGLVPREYSSGNSTWRGEITKAGNVHVRTQLVESAWAYRFQPNVSAVLRRRQQGIDPAVAARAWAAQLRRCRRFRHLANRKQSQSTVNAAVARELAGFVWAEMTI